MLSWHHPGLNRMPLDTVTACAASLLHCVVDRSGENQSIISWHVQVLRALREGRGQGRSSQKRLRRSLRLKRMRACRREAAQGESSCLLGGLKRQWRPLNLRILLLPRGEAQYIWMPCLYRHQSLNRHARGAGGTPRSALGRLNGRQQQQDS